MNILLIGNGFDLAHGLPTSYVDFLDFCKMIKAVYDINEKRHPDDIWETLNLKIEGERLKRLKYKFSELYSVAIVENNWERGSFVRTGTAFDELYDLVKGNIWIEYFENNQMYNKENWIDFESEISKVIQLIDKDMFDEKGEKRNISDGIINLSDEFLRNRFGENVIVYAQIKFLNGEKNTEILSYQKLRDVLYLDLNRITRALEIYLVEYVMKMECNITLPCIKNLEIDKLVSFNYTDTYIKLYNAIDDDNCDYVHGKLKDSNTIATNNMVLGIEEYLPKERKNKEIEFIAFKKFYQRICKQTGCKYKEWADEIESDGNLERLNLREEFRSKMRFEDFGNQNYLYIFGHSLDVTDKDVLERLILNDNVYTTIFYREKFDADGNGDNGREDLGQKIANLVKVIGQDELIRRTGGNTKTIEFKIQNN